MDKINNELKRIGYDTDNRKQLIFFKNETVHGVVVAPHDGTNWMYMIRFSTIVAFDRWANSCAVEEFFAKEDDVVNYLNTKQLDVYKKLVAYLSQEYKDLDGYRE